MLHRAFDGHAVIDLVDPLDETVIELRRDGRGQGGVRLVQQRGHGAGAENLPDQPGGGKGRAVGACGGARLVMVEAVRALVVHAAHIPDDIAAGDEFGVAGAAQNMVAAQRQAQHRIGEHLVAMEFPAMGDEDGRRLAGRHEKSDPKLALPGA